MSTTPPLAQGDSAVKKLFETIERIKESKDPDLTAFRDALTPQVVDRLWDELRKSDLFDEYYLDRIKIRPDDVGDKVIVEMWPAVDPSYSAFHPDTFFVRETPLWLLVYGLVLAITSPVLTDEKTVGANRMHR